MNDYVIDHIESYVCCGTKYPESALATAILVYMDGLYK